MKAKWKRPASRPKKYSIDEVEAALCLWESFHDLEQGNEPTIAKTLRLVREGNGAFECRRLMVELALKLDKMWKDELTDAERDDWTFDWEFCPMFLSHAVDWDGKWGIDEVPTVFKDGWHRMKAHAALHQQFGRAS